MSEIEYEILEKEMFGNYKTPVYKVYEKPNFYKIIISRGEKPSSGYGIDILKIIQKKEKVIIYIRFINPEDEFVNQIFTYPLIKLKVAKSNLEFYDEYYFIFKDEEGKILKKI